MSRSGFASALILALGVASTGGSIAAAGPQAAAGATLDYETFKTKVQPILMAKRKGHARCVSCHAQGGGDAYLEPLPPGTPSYTEDQTRRNFERISQRLVVAGDPMKSLLLTNPLAEDAGGSHWHGGGKHWQSQTDPEWQTLASWVRGR